MRFAPAAALAALLTAGVAGAQVIDRVMAVVNGAVITQTDVEAVLRFGLLQPRPVPEVVERLIDRRLVIVEVNRYSPPEPAPAVIEARLDEVRRRFQSDERFARTLLEVGIGEDQLRAHLRDSVRIQAYLRQRFGAAYQPPDTDILQYYRTHPKEFTRNGALLSYGEAYDDARAALIVQRREEQIEEWLAGLRRRADIVQTTGEPTRNVTRPLNRRIPHPSSLITESPNRRIRNRRIRRILESAEFLILAERRRAAIGDSAIGLDSAMRAIRDSGMSDQGSADSDHGSPRPYSFTTRT